MSEYNPSVAAGDETLWCLVLGTEGFKGTRRIHTYAVPEAVISTIIKLASDAQDPRKVFKIFTVSPYGNIVEYKFVFDEKFRLESVPSVEQRCLECDKRNSQ